MSSGGPTAERARVMHRLARSRVLWCGVLLLLLYALGGFFVAPYVIERNVASFVEDRLGQRASVADIRINPFALTFEASGFRLEGGGAKPLLAFDRVYLDLELSSVVRRAWTFADIRLEGADVALEIDSTGRLNAMDLLERFRTAPQPDAAPPPVVIRHAAMNDGRVSLLDLSGATPAMAAVTGVDLEIFELSTLADHPGRYTLAATLPADGTLNAKGDLSLQPIASSGELSMRAMKIETPWRFLRDELNLAELRGELAITGSYDFSYEDGAPALAASALQAELSGLFIALRGEERPLVALSTIRMSDASFVLATQDIVVPSLRLSDGALNASMSEHGRLDWQEIAPRDAAGTAEADIQIEAQPWRVRLQDVGIEKVAVAYVDRSRNPHVTVHTAALNGALRLAVTTRAPAAQIVADDISLTLDTNTVSTPGLDAPTARSSPAAPLARLDSFALDGGRIDTGGRTLAARTISMSGGDLKLVRARDGSTALLEAFLPAKGGSIAADSASNPVVASAWKYRVETIAVKRVAVALADHTYEPALAYNLGLVSAAAKNIDSAATTPIAFTTQWRVGERGSASARGTLRQDFAGARAAVEVARVPLVPLQPLLAKHAALELESGDISASAQLTYRSAAEPALTASGRVSIDDVLVNEIDSGDRFASWKTLTGDDVALSLSPNRLAIRDVRVLEPGAKIVIYSDRTINLDDVLRKDVPAARAAGAEQARAASEPAAASAEAPALPYEIGRIRLENGTLDFADLSLVLPFATRVHAVEGAIVGLSSAPDARAELKLQGEIDAYGEARAEGVLIPRSPTTFLDITAHFDNVQMPLLTPYSATFAGRKIAAGKLSLTLEYKIIDSELAGENRIVLRDFKLGERVEAPNALDLPLDLAVALLKDSEGKISLAVPVRGNVGSPEFDYGTVIRGAIANTLRRVVTAPFRMLAKLFGQGNAEEIRSVEFAPGSERIAPAQREQLDALAQALKARPQLKLVVRGPYDAERDGKQLRRAAARRELARRLGVELEAGENPGPVAYASADTQKALEALLIERAGPDAVAALANAYAKRTGRQPDRMNPVLGFFGRGSTDRDFYQAVFERLVELQPLPDTAVRVLAASRAEAIVDTLVEAGIDPRRVQSGGITEVETPSGSAVATELALGVIPGAS